MGVHQKIYTLSDGQKVNIHEIMAKTGIKESAARHRLSQGRDVTKILATKGTHKDYGYGRRRVLKKPPKKVKINDQTQKKPVFTMESHIKKTKPFYADPLFRLALMKISISERPRRSKAK